MVSSPAQTVAAYLHSLPSDRRAVVATVRDVVNANLPAGYEECMQYGMIGWVVPFSRYAHTYNGQPLAMAALAAQKTGYSLYLTGPYTLPAMAAWFVKAYQATGKKLDMGKSCVRFKSLEQLPLEVIAEAIRKVPVDDFVAAHEAVMAPAATKKAATKKPATKKPVAKKPAATKKPVAKKPVAKKPKKQ